ncbi:phosphotransferase [Microlunatus speluncae]|uniref:phosphotransferase n=1 Tax=Microlunatus speluncae TaxID=2594267 RepID=UPI0012662FF7|nr:phosphotransferase [Microlunatus speluncae]
MTEELSWPEDMVPREEMRAWLSTVLPGHPRIAPQVTPLRVKRWGATGTFLADGVPIVGKHAQPALYPSGPAVHRFVQDVAPHAIAPMLATEDGPGWQRTAFGLIEGPTAETRGVHSRVEVARTIAAIQIAAAERPAPCLPSYQLPDLIDDLVDDVLSMGDQDPSLLGRLSAAAARLHDYAEQLASAVPVSIDHCDLNEANAIIPDQGPVVILDWEEARLGCPLLSLSRLLQAAEPYWDEITDAYTTGLSSWGDVGPLISRANIVAPVKSVHEARAYARALAWPAPYANHERETTRLLTVALDRLDALTGESVR